MKHLRTWRACALSLIVAGSVLFGFAIARATAQDPARLAALNKAALGAWSHPRAGFSSDAAPRSWLLDVIEYGQAHQVDVLRDGVAELVR